MPPTLRNGRHGTTARPTPSVTTALLRRRARELDRHLPSAREGNDKGVHQARVASRRLREAIPVLAPSSKARRKAARSTRRVTRTLGAVRELDVALGILDELATRSTIPRNALEDVRGHVVAERERHRESMRRRLDRVDSARLRRRLDALAAAVSEAETQTWREALARRIVHRARRLGRAIDAAGRMYAPEQLHDVRIATKKLRYALELAADARLAGARPLVAPLKRAQDTLGRLHDLQVIQQYVAAVQAAPPARHGADDGGLDIIASALEADCRHLHARYSKQVPSLIELVARCEAGFVDASPRRRQRPAVVPPASLRALVARRL